MDFESFDLSRTADEALTNPAPTPTNRELLLKILYKVEKIEQSIDTIDGEVSSVQEQLEELEEAVKNLSSDTQGFGIEDLT